MKKVLSNQGFFALLYILFGVILLIHPVEFSRMVCYVVGICVLVYGGWRIYGYWKIRKMAGFFQMDLIAGVVLAAVGLIALFKPEILISVLPLVLGLIILMDGLVTINQAMNLKKLDYRWKYLLGIGIAVSILGIILVVNPFGSAMVLMRFLGVTLIVDGGCELWWYYGLKKIFEG